MVDDWLEGLREQVESGPGAGSTLVVGVSGGSDSVALLHGLVALRERLGLRLVVAHLDHALRPDSAEDAAWVGHLAMVLGVLCLRERRDIAALAASEQRNVEESARKARYRLFESAARAAGANAIAVAHTANDQAETVLMHLLRGAGLDGLKGMLPLAPSPLPDAQTAIFRPLLTVTRSTLREWLTEHGLAWREDPSNADLALFRNRLRHRVLPMLEKERPQLVERLARTAQVLAADNAFLEEATSASWERLTQVYAEAIHWERPSFLELPPALQRRLLRRAYFYLRGDARDLSFEQVEQALEVATTGQRGSRATLPGRLFLIVEGDALWVGEAVDLSGALQVSEPLELPEQGEIETSTLRITLDIVGREALPEKWSLLPSTSAFFDMSRVHHPLQLRAPAADDRWTPLGMGGHSVDLREWMAKRKVPLSERDVVPLLVDAADNILWVVGWEVSDLARVRPDSKELLRIKVEAVAAEQTEK